MLKTHRNRTNDGKWSFLTEDIEHIGTLDTEVKKDLERIGARTADKYRISAPKDTGLLRQDFSYKTRRTIYGQKLNIGLVKGTKKDKYGNQTGKYGTIQDHLTGWFKVRKNQITDDVEDQITREIDKYFR